MDADKGFLPADVVELADLAESVLVYCVKQLLVLIRL